MANGRDPGFLGTLIGAYRVQIEHLKWIQRSEEEPGTRKGIRKGLKHSRELLREYRDTMDRHRVQQGLESFGWYLESGAPRLNPLEGDERAAFDAQFSHIAAAMYAIDEECRTESDDD